MLALGNNKKKFVGKGQKTKRTVKAKEEDPMHCPWLRTRAHPSAAASGSSSSYCKAIVSAASLSFLGSSYFSAATSS